MTHLIDIIFKYIFVFIQINGSPRILFMVNKTLSYDKTYDKQIIITTSRLSLSRHERHHL